MQFVKIHRPVVCPRGPSDALSKDTPTCRLPPWSDRCTFKRYTDLSFAPVVRQMHFLKIHRPVVCPRGPSDAICKIHRPVVCPRGPSNAISKDRPTYLPPQPVESNAISSPFHPVTQVREMLHQYLQDRSGTVHTL